MDARAGIVVALLLVSGCTGSTPPLTSSTQEAPPVGTTRVAAPTDTAPTALGFIQGSVSNDEGIPIAAAMVRLTEADVSVAVDERGGFEFLDVPVGTYVLEAQATGHAGQARMVNVVAEQATRVSFTLQPLVADVPRVEIFTHVTMINWSVGDGSVLYRVPGSCTQNCEWRSSAMEPPDHAIVEISGNHSFSHPRGWDGLGVRIQRYPQNSTDSIVIWRCVDTYTNVYASCLRLPIRISLNSTALSMENDFVFGPTGRLRVDYYCEPLWFCIEERYTTYLSVFFGYKEEEIPPDWSAQTGG